MDVLKTLLGVLSAKKAPGRTGTFFAAARELGMLVIGEEEFLALLAEPAGTGMKAVPVQGELF